MPSSRTPEDRAIEQKMLDAVADVIRDTEFAPEEGGILVDALVVMISVDRDGDHGISWMSHGSVHQAEGMARKVVRDIVFHSFVDHATDEGD